MARSHCNALTRAGIPCRSFAVADGLCQAHHPDRADAHREAMRKGGEQRSAVRRAAKLWASRGEQIEPKDLPSFLRATLIDLRAGTVEPSVASAIASVAKASVSLSHDLELEDRLTRLEEAVGIAVPDNVRLITSRKVGT